MHQKLTVKAGDVVPVSMDGGAPYLSQIPSSTPSHPHTSSWVAMKTGSGRDHGGGRDEGRVVVSFVTKMEIASEGEI